MKPVYWDTAFGYAHDCISGKITANKYRIKGCQRFIDDLNSGKWDFKPEMPEKIIKTIETMLVHQQGEDMNGQPMRGKPFKLLPFHKFCIYNLYGFKKKGTEINRFQEGLIFIPRKNVKTTFAGSLAFANGLAYKDSGAKMYVVAAALKQTMEVFNFMEYNIRNMGADDKNGDGPFHIINNNNEHSIKGEIGNGLFSLEALASNPDSQDSFNCNFTITDEMHAFKKAKQYTLFREAMNAYRNKLLLGISTAGDDPNGFLAERVKFSKRILDKEVEADYYFCFICEADPEENGTIDYLNPRVQEMANPGYGVTVNPEDLMQKAISAQNNPLERKEYFTKSLNVFTSSIDTYFDMTLVRKSDEKYSWTLEELSKLPITWYGGADLSKRNDLSGAALHGRYKDIDIAITHAFIPVTAAAQKVEEDGIPFYWWEEMGWLTLCNSSVIEHEDIVKWFISMKKRGFKIKWVGYDRRYAREFVLKMKKAGFKMRDQSQRYTEKTEAFREIETQIIKGNYYYMHNKAYEYCIENVKAIEDSDDFVRYEKIRPQHRIDLFDADVIATKQMLIGSEKKANEEKWKG